MTTVAITPAHERLRQRILGGGIDGLMARGNINKIKPFRSIINANGHLLRGYPARRQRAVFFIPDIDGVLYGAAIKKKALVSHYVQSYYGGFITRDDSQGRTIFRSLDIGDR